jgi:hypothetical protein
MLTNNNDNNDHNDNNDNNNSNDSNDSNDISFVYNYNNCDEDDSIAMKKREGN